MRPTSLIAVTNDLSRALIPSALYLDGLEDAAKEAANHIYLVAIAPRVDALSVERSGDGWKLRTQYFDGKWKPRTLPIARELFPTGTVRVKDSVLIHVTDQGEQRLSAVEVARMVLDRSNVGTPEADQLWKANTIKKFFTYQIVYVGQAYGRDTRRSAVKRLADGHEKLQRVLAAVNDHYRTSDVGIIVANARVQGREMNLSVNSGNVVEAARATRDFITTAFGPLEDDGSTIDAVEAMLIRYFQPPLNDRLKEFPLRDRPGLVEPMLNSGITHLGIHFDVSESHALLADPQTGESKSWHRFAVNLRDGTRETPATSAPLAWRM